MTESAWVNLSDKEYRDAFAEGLVDDRLSAQIYYLRRHRDWTQQELAQRSGLTQPTISSLEDSTEGARLNTLRKIASAFDVALDARFASFSALLTAFKSAPLNSDVRPFDEDAPPGARQIQLIVSTGSPIISGINRATTPSVSQGGSVRSFSSSAHSGPSYKETAHG